MKERNLAKTLTNKLLDYLEVVELVDLPDRRFSALMSVLVDLAKLDHRANGTDVENKPSKEVEAFIKAVEDDLNRN